MFENGGPLNQWPTNRVWTEWDAHMRKCPALGTPALACGQLEHLVRR